MDLSAIDTPRLAAMAKEHAKGVGAVNDAAWDAVLPAYIASAAAIAVAVPCLALSNIIGLRGAIEYPWVALAALAVVCASPWVRKWNRAISDVKAHAAQSKHYTAELRRRNGSPVDPENKPITTFWDRQFMWSP